MKLYPMNAKNFLRGAISGVLPPLLLTLFVSTSSWAIGMNPSPDNPPCPQIGYANGCNVIITISSSGTVSFVTTSQTAYDGNEDQLIGVINNYTATVFSLYLTSTFG